MSSRLNNYCYEQVRQQDFYIGSVRVNGDTDWSTLDTIISTLFKVSSCGLKYLIQYDDAQACFGVCTVDLMLMTCSLSFSIRTIFPRWTRVLAWVCLWTPSTVTVFNRAGECLEQKPQRAHPATVSKTTRDSLQFSSKVRISSFHTLSSAFIFKSSSHFNVTECGMLWEVTKSQVYVALQVDKSKEQLGLETSWKFRQKPDFIVTWSGYDVHAPSHCLFLLLVVLGFKEKCVDSLVFETLIPKPMMQHYISLLLKHRRLILSGPSGTGKTYLATRLAEYLLERSGRELGPGNITTFNMHQQTCKVKLCLILTLLRGFSVPMPHISVPPHRTSSCTCLIWPIRLTEIVALTMFR